MAAASPSTRASVRLGTITLWASTSVTVRASSVAAVSAARRLTIAPAIPTATATTTLANANRVRARRVLVDPCACPAGAGRSPILIPPSPVRPGRRPCHHGRRLRTSTPVGRAAAPAPPVPRDCSDVVATLALVVPGLGLAPGGLGGGGVVGGLGPGLAAVVVGDRPGRDRRLDLRGGGGRGHDHRDRDRRHRDHADRHQDALAHCRAPSGLLCGTPLLSRIGGRALNWTWVLVPPGAAVPTACSAPISLLPSSCPSSWELFPFGGTQEGAPRGACAVPGTVDPGDGGGGRPGGLRLDHRRRRRRGRWWRRHGRRRE